MRDNDAFRASASRRTVLRTLGAGAALVAAPAVLRAQTPIVMKIGTPTINDNQHEWMKTFAAAIETGTKGAIKAELYPASQLGSAPRMIEGVQFGTIQAFVMPPEFLSGVDSRFEVLSAPGLFKDVAHAERSLHSPEFNKAFLAIGETRGLKGVGLYTSAQMVINCRTKLNTVADVAGKKIRVLASAMQTEQTKRMKATGIPMALSEVMPAVQQGTIDGVMSALPVITALRFYDAAKYILETDHAIVTVVAAVSKIWFDKLPKEHQAAIVAAGQQADKEITGWNIEFEKRQRAAWLAAGGEIVKISAAEREELMKLMLPIGAEVAGRKPAEKALFDLLLKTAAATA